jgi:hypothetical protein
MSAKDFNERLALLVQEALSQPPAPIHQMIVSLETNKTRCVSLLINFENEKAAQEMANRIIPANGKLPEIHLDN